MTELLGSARPDRGYALLLAEARYLAARRSLALDRLVVLDAFTGNEVASPNPDDVSDPVREKRRIQAGELLRRGRELVLAGGAPDEENLNLLEEAAAVAARSGRADAAGPLSEYGMRKLPALGRSVAVPLPGGDPTAALALARARLAAQDARLEARWGYDLTQHNCITELARTTGGAFGSEAEAARALGAEVPAPDEPLGFVPFVFFDRVRDRLRVERVDELPGRRAQELERVLRESPGALDCSARVRGSDLDDLHAAPARRRLLALHRRRVLAPSRLRRGESDLRARLHRVRRRRCAVRRRLAPASRRERTSCGACRSSPS